MITGKTYFEMSQQEHMPNQTQILETENMAKIKREIECRKKFKVADQLTQIACIHCQH